MTWSKICKKKKKKSILTFEEESSAALYSTPYRLGFDGFHMVSLVFTDWPFLSTLMGQKHF